MTHVRDARDPLPRWSVDIPFTNADKTTGVQTFVVRAETGRQAVGLAYQEAKQPPAVASRRGARVSAKPRHLRAERIPGSEE